MAPPAPLPGPEEHVDLFGHHVAFPLWFSDEPPTQHPDCGLAACSQTLSDHLNDRYSDPLFHPCRLFTNPTNPTCVLDNTILLPLIRRIISYDMIAMNAYGDTYNANVDYSCVAPLINAAPLFVSSPGVPPTKLTAGSLTAAVNDCLSPVSSHNHIVLTICTGHFQLLDPTQSVCFRFKWSQLATTSTPLPIPPPTADPSSLQLLPPVVNDANSAPTVVSPAAPPAAKLLNSPASLPIIQDFQLGRP